MSNKTKAKLIMAAAVAYLIFPFDLVPDLFLGLGQLDDMAVMAAATKKALEFWRTPDPQVIDVPQEQRAA